jgi:hypothetical protein
MYVHDTLHHGPLVDDHKMPGLPVDGRRGVHGSPQQGFHGGFIDLLIRESAYTPPVQDMVNFVYQAVHNYV